MAPIPSNSITSRARRPKNACFFYTCKISDTYEIGIGYKNSKGEGAPYSTCSKSVYRKIPFGPPTRCDYVTRKDNDGEYINEFQFKNNRRESAGCNEILLNNFEASKDNPLNAKITTLFIEGKKNLLANYISAAQSSKGFFFHSELYDDDGLSLQENVRFDGSNIKLADISSNGGTIDELREFIQLCRDYAVFGESKELVNNEVFKKFKKAGKRSSTDSSKVIKLSKRATLDANEKAELEDPEGLEQQFQNLYVNLVKIKLDNISLCKSIGVVPNNYRVNSIAQSIKCRYDPSQAILVVAPDSSSTGTDPDNPSLKSFKFVVVQKIHTFEAFRLLDKTGDFEKLTGHQERNVLCYVINTESIALMRYGHSRANDVGQQVGRKTSPQDLLHIFETIVVNEGRENALKVVVRMSKLTRTGPNEDTALRKLWKWRPSTFTKLMEVVRSYESYETTDVRTSHCVAASIARGDKLTIPNKLINDLAKVDEVYFENNYQKILDRELSLRSMIQEFKNVKEMKQVYGILCQISGYRSLEDLKLLYPDKFSEDIMVKFMGADNESQNLKCKMLVNYYKEIVAGCNTADSIPVEFKVVNSIDELLVETVTNQYDVVVLIVKEQLKYLYTTVMRKIFESTRTIHIGIFVFPSELLSFEAITFLRSQSRSLLNNFSIVPVTFSDDAAKVVNNLVENVRYGVIFGTFDVLNGPLEAHYNSVKKFPVMLSKIAPPRSKIAVVFGPKVDFIEVHDNQSSNHIVRYYGENAAFDTFEKSLKKGSKIDLVALEDPSTSKHTQALPSVTTKKDESITSPLKPTDNDLSPSSQDSGIGSQDTLFRKPWINKPLRQLTFSEQLEEIAKDNGIE